MACPNDTKRISAVSAVTPLTQKPLWMSFEAQDIVEALKFLPDAGPVFGAKNLKKLQDLGVVLSKLNFSR